MNTVAEALFSPQKQCFLMLQGIPAYKEELPCPIIPLLKRDWRLKMVCAKIFLSAHGRLPPTISKYCKLCGTCNDICPDFEEQVCIVRLKPTYVCNACEERSRCTLLKTLYSAIKAQQGGRPEYLGIPPGCVIHRTGTLCVE